MISKHLCLNYINAYYAGEKAHAQEIMKKLGITYQCSTPQSISDSFWFWNCENIPENLPSYITELNIDDPMEFVGWGLSKEEAIKIKKYKRNMFLSQYNIK
jgi:hypothetical protein